MSWADSASPFRVAHSRRANKKARPKSRHRLPKPECRSLLLDNPCPCKLRLNRDPLLHTQALQCLVQHALVELLTA